VNLKNSTLRKTSRKTNDSFDLFSFLDNAFSIVQVIIEAIIIYFIIDLIEKKRKKKRDL